MIHVVYQVLTTCSVCCLRVVVADTVVIFPPEHETAEGGIAHGEVSEVLEKPFSRDEQVRAISLRWMIRRVQPFITDTYV